MKFRKLTAFLTVVCILLCLCSCKKEVQKTEKTLFAMDTYMTFTVYGENSEKTAEKCMDEIKRLDALLSADILHQNPPHRLRRRRKKMPPEQLTTRAGGRFGVRGVRHSAKPFGQTPENTAFLLSQMPHDTKN